MLYDTSMHREGDAHAIMMSNKTFIPKIKQRNKSIVQKPNKITEEDNELSYKG